MTLIAGLKADGFVYMMADSSVTRSSPESSPFETTASGEPIGNHSGHGTTSDGVWKLITLAPGVIGTFTGNTIDAVESGVNSPSFEEAFTALVACNVGGEPRLYGAAHVPGNVSEVRELPDDRLHILPRSTQPRLADLFSQARGTARPGAELLAVMMGQLQAATVRMDLKTKAIGGLFSGAYWTGESQHWQPDMNFRYYDSTDKDRTRKSKAFNSIIREGRWIVGSDLLKKTRYHPTRVRPPWFEERWGDFFTGYTDYGRWDYWAHCDATTDRVVIVEMRKHLSTYYMRLEKKGRHTWRTHIAQELQDSLYDPIPNSDPMLSIFTIGDQVRNGPPEEGYPDSWNDLDEAN